MGRCWWPRFISCLQHRWRVQEHSRPGECCPASPRCRTQHGSPGSPLCCSGGELQRPCPKVEPLELDHGVHTCCSAPGPLGAGGNCNVLTGRCACGALRYQIDAAPLAMYHCHCGQCRRASGSAFATNILVKSESFELTAGEAALASFESSPGKRRYFCSRCGSPIFSESAATP